MSHFKTQFGACIFFYISEWSLLCWSYILGQEGLNSFSKKNTAKQTQQPLPKNRVFAYLFR